MKYLHLMLLIFFFSLEAIEHSSTKTDWQASMPQIRGILISHLVGETKELSQKLPKSSKQKPYLFLMRGNSGSGKSQTVSSITYKLDRGVINPDIAKFRLREMAKKELGVNLSYQEADIEGEKIFQEWIEEFIKTHKSCSFIIDRRMLSVLDIEKKLQTAQAADAEVYLIDIEAPLETSCIRCLIRPKGEKNPTVDYECIEEGYRKIHQERAALIRHILNPSGNSSFHLVTHYELHYNDGMIDCLVASKNPDQGWVIYHPQLFDQIVYQPLDKIEEAIHAMRNTTIDDTFIEKALTLSLVQTLRKEGKSAIIKQEIVEQIIKEVIQSMKGEDFDNIKSECNKAISSSVSSPYCRELEIRAKELAVEFNELIKFTGKPLPALLVAQ
ncbi:MAG: AAA family ATPase [Verrucomicrobia bacterium]|nr:AAA family ATPase [Verrucomicrobiota bacterium]